MPSPAQHSPDEERVLKAILDYAQNVDLGELNEGEALDEIVRRARAALAAAEQEEERDTETGDRLYTLLALFDTRDGSELADLVRSAREGYERSHPDMGEAENREAWAEFDSRWWRLTPEQRLALVDHA